MLDGALAKHDISVGVLFSRTDWTQWWHPSPKRWPLVTAIRRTEEAITARRFGYRVRTASLQELILRTGEMDPAVYLSDIDNFAVNDLHNVVDAVESTLAAWSRDADLVISPLGVGNHHDHQIVAEAARRLGDLGSVPVAFYEDRPYTAWAGGEAQVTFAERIGARSGVTLQRRAASGPITAAKHRKLVYPSQLSSDFKTAIAADESAATAEHVWVFPGAAWPPVPA